MTTETQGNQPSYPFLGEYNANFVMISTARERVITDDRFDVFDKTVIDTVLQPNDEFQTTGKHFDQISNAITSRVLDIPTLFDIGTTLGHDICVENKSPRAKIVAYLNVLSAIDQIKIGTIGVRSSTATTNGIADYLRIMIASELPNKPITQQLLSVFNQTFEHAEEFEPEKELYEWLHTKVRLLEVSFQRQANVIGIAERYDANLPESEYEIETLTRYATLLTKDAMNHRKYGTKPAYTEASIGGSWMFYDGMDWKKMVNKGVRNHGVKQYDDIAAVVLHSPHKDLTSLSAGVEYNANGIGIFTGGLSSAETDLQMYINKDGSMSLDPYGIQDVGLLGIAKAQELALRAEISSNFYDLSVPIYKNRPDRNSFNSFTNTQKETFNPIQDLLIPRIRYIGEDPTQGQSDIVRTVRAHDVTWFVRVLPSGWHASPESQAQAAEYGIVLADNETFVRSHVRGENNKVMAYHAIRR